jgi:small-conductance mechanosensitive channel
MARVPDYVIDCLAIMLLAIVISKTMRWLIKRQLSKMDPESAESTGLKFLKNTLRFLIWMTAGFAMVFSIPQLQTVAKTLFAGAGLLVAILGFAAQAALGNIISGFFIVIFKPFRVGDIITVGTEFRGKVTDITLRHTNIRDFRNRRIIIPNSQVSSQTIVNENIADTKICRWVEFRVALSSNIDLAIATLRQEAENHPLCVDNRSDEDKALNQPKVNVKVTLIGEYFAELTAFVWTPGPSESWELHTDLNYSVKKAFEAQGIEIPVPHRKIISEQPITSANHG